MCFKNTAERFGLVAQGFHWVIAFLIVGMLALGLYMEEMERSPEKFELYGIHKSFGILVLALVVLRILWRFMNATPAPLPNHQRWEVVLAKSVQGILYLMMMVMPLSGWMMSSAGGHDVAFFGLFTMPPLVEKSKEIGEIASEIHEVAAWIMIGAIVLHVAGALKHKLIDKDGTVARMLPWGHAK
ncbi:MAG: cytochrome b [Rhodospirillales bacterium]|nr:cytochrome b [Rhodospirillales bacterium]